jgi:hypothetical protein
LEEEEKREDGQENDSEEKLEFCLVINDNVLVQDIKNAFRKKDTSFKNTIVKNSITKELS